MRAHILILSMVSLAACEPEIVTPTATQVGLPFSSGENVDLCESALCVERATTQTVNSATGPGFLRRSACPTPEYLASSGLTYADHLIDYDYSLGKPDENISLTFNGELCTRGLSAQALRETLIRGSSAHYVPASQGRAGYAGGPLELDSIEFVDAAAGRVHVRIKAAYRSLQRSSEELLCVNSAGHVPTLSGCSCSYVGGPFAYTFDLDLPISPLTN